MHKPKIKIIPYTANAGLGLIFPAKTIIIQEDNTYIISPGPLQIKDVPNVGKIHFIAPNGFHHFHLAHMKKLFPSASFYGPKRAMRQSGVELLPLSDLNNNKDHIKLISIHGHKTLAETCFYYEHSKTLIVTDIFFNLNHEMSLASAMWFKLFGVYHQVATSKLLQLTMNNKGQFYNSLNQLLDFPFETIILNHGDSISRDEFIQYLNNLKRTWKL